MRARGDRPAIEASGGARGAEQSARWRLAAELGQLALCPGEAVWRVAAGFGLLLWM